uniref:Uncharacterized protein n=1 Tax=Arundo donax TaxID=35708 RepID=A0A0A8Y3T4_ARUDO
MRDGVPALLQRSPHSVLLSVNKATASSVGSSVPLRDQRPE